MDGAAALREAAIGALARGDTALAVRNLARCVAVASADADVWVLYAEALVRDGQPQASARASDRVCELCPGSPDAWFLAGLAWFRCADLEPAAARFERARALAPDDPQALEGLGMVLHRRRALEAAAAHFRAAIVGAPARASAHANLAATLTELARYDEAAAHARRALDLDPGDAQARFAQACLALLAGRYAQAWGDFEARREIEQVRPFLRPRHEPRWEGDPMQGRALLVHAEQGLGDTLQFVRYAPLAAARGARVVLHVPRPLVRLLARAPGVSAAHPAESAPPGADKQIPLMSLPGLFGTTLADVPADIPYLSPDPAQVSAAASLFAGERALRVGLVWSGNPDHLRDRERSLDAALFAPLSAIRGVRLYSLQKGAAAKDQNRIGPEVVALGPRASDFADTAALMAHLDLVVAVDTAVAHLAGGMGKPVLLLLSYVPDWRWLLDRDDSPWYPGMRLYRQGPDRQWPPVVERVVTDVARMASGRVDAVPVLHRPDDRAA
jgi:tetratricopeptide (TPR) repeat protein